jgi:hypothetical protein
MKLLKAFSGLLALAALMVPAAATADQSYTVRSGETWASIAAAQCRQGTQAAALAQYNRSSASSPLRPGSTITIPDSLSNRRGATLQSAQGTVTVNNRSASAGQALSASDTIVTGPSSRADVMLDNGSVMRLGPNTRISLSQLAMNGRNLSTGTNLQNGSMTMQVTRLNRESSFSVNTVSAVAGVRGTYFYISYDESTGDLGIACYSGRVVVGNATTDAAGNAVIDSATAVNVDAGHATTVDGASGAVTQPFPIPGRIQWADESN